MNQLAPQPNTDADATAVAAKVEKARDWLRLLSKYREPILWRSLFELAVTLVPFFALWTLAWLALSVSPWLAAAIALVNGLFLVRLFAIQHDCGHAAFFANRQLSDWTGRALGVLTLTPYDVWKRTHAIHHSASGNLDQRGMGDIMTLTVAEYNARSAWGKFLYRCYRSPLVLFVIGPAYVFFLQYRLPIGFMKSRKYWTSAMGTNLAIAVVLGVIVYFGGWAPILTIFIPTSLLAAMGGVWLFYVQHQFEETHWDHADEWDMHDAALHGSSHYELGTVLQWMTANIGLHHVHHLYSRIPFYRLTEVMRDHPDLDENQRLTIRESIACVKLRLWDEKERKLMSYKQARALYGTPK
jgi:omega-6 fatty acid desaturase (delta-12 desaturase)